MKSLANFFSAFQNFLRHAAVSRGDDGQLTHPTRDWLLFLAATMLVGIGLALWSLLALRDAATDPVVTTSNSPAPFVDRAMLSKTLARYRGKEQQFETMLGTAPVPVSVPRIQAQVGTSTAATSSVAATP